LRAFQKNAAGRGASGGSLFEGGLREVGGIQMDDPGERRGCRVGLKSKRSRSFSELGSGKEKMRRF